MPTYTFTHPDNGRTVKITGDTPPDEATIDKIFAETRGAAAGKPGWDATGVSFKGGKPTGGTRRDVMGIATPSERRRPVTPGVLGKTYAGRLAAKPMPTVKQLQAAPELTPEEKNRLAGEGMNWALGVNVDRPTLEPLIAGGRNLINRLSARGLPFSDKRNAYRAAQQFAAAQEPGSPVAAAANAARQAETQGLVNRLQPTVTPTPGQAAGNYRSAALEQSMSSKDPAFAERLKYRDAELNKAAVENLTRTLGRPAELPAVQPASMTGEAQVKAVKGAMEPVLSKEAQMWADVPNYPMPAGNTETAFKEVLATPSTARKAAQNVYGIFKQTPRTVEGLQTIERELNSAMKAGTDTDRHYLRQVRDAVRQDFEAMGEAAEAGDVALHNGRIVYPSKLRAELASVEERLAAAVKKAGSAESRVDMQHPSGFVGRIEQEKAVKDVGRLTAERTALQEQLANLQPAEDVAAKYAAAKKYSREEKFERFYRGAVKDVLGTGDQASGLRIPPEQVPAKFFTPQGSKDLVKAVGRETAAEQSAPHVVEQLISKTVDASTGVMNIPRATAWMRQNADALNTLGLTKSVEQTIKGQIPRAIEAELETKAVDVLGNPAATTLQAAKIIKKFGPAVERMYGSKGMQALKDYGKMMEIIGRNKYVSYAKGGTTVEKGAMPADMAEKVSTLAAVATGHGWVFSATKNIAKSLMGPALNFSKAQVNALLQEALINPAAAEALMKIARAKPAEVSAIAPKLIKPLLVQMQVSAMPRQEESNASQSTP